MTKKKAAITIILIIAIAIATIAILVLGSNQFAKTGNISVPLKSAAEKIAREAEKQKAKEARVKRLEKQKVSEAKSKTKKLNIDITEDFHDEFVHGDKGPEFQKYIMLHDTESSADASTVVQSWLGQGKGIASHFIVNKDGTIVQCVPMDKIAHHAGFGNVGHNEEYGVTDESRDDKVGTESIGEKYPDYGMNSYSIGIEIVHVGGGDEYPEAQLEALDKLIAYIDEHYGTESRIIDHKMWRTTNSDTSPEFGTYLNNYKSNRSHKGEKEN